MAYHKDMGDMRQIRSKLSAKYDPEAEREVLGWLSELIKFECESGSFNVEKNLKTGIPLIQLMEVLYKGTPNKPAKCDKIKLKANTMSVPFKQMENIQIFLNAAEAYGVSKGQLFQTVDLYEGRNMSQVLATILAVGTEAQRHEFNGPVVGPKPTEKNERNFSEEQLAKGKSFIGLQMGTNKLASQSGMSMGGQRHIADIRCDDMSAEGAGIIGGQAGYNKGASQSGMSFGSVRHIKDIECDDLTREGASIIGGQAGYNKGASQSGMSFGSVRHAKDIDAGEASKDGLSIIGGQMGYNQGASQAGMSFGNQRHINDIKVDEMNDESKNVINLQMGSNLGASQSGLSMGKQRHIVD